MRQSGVVRPALRRDGGKTGEPSSKNPCKNKASDAVRPLLQLVDRPERWANPIYLHDFIEVSLRTRPKSSNKIPKRYLESELSSQQIADEFGVSKQFVLTQLRAAGIRKTARRGRSETNYRFHNPPYGFRVRNGRLETDRVEMRTARMICELRDRQRKSFPEIAKELYARRWFNRKGGEWNKVAVRHVHRRWTGKL